jgi:Flp pilus assembly protein TadG
MAMLLGIIDFGRAVYTYHLVSEGARSATRYAIVNGVASCAGGSPDPLQAYVADASWGITPSQLTVTTTCAGGNTGCSSTSAPYDGPGCLVSVNVAYSFHFIVPLISLLVIPMASRSQMVISQ